MRAAADHALAAYHVRGAAATRVQSAWRRALARRELRELGAKKEARERLRRREADVRERRALAHAVREVMRVRPSTAAMAQAKLGRRERRVWR